MKRLTEIHYQTLSSDLPLPQMNGQETGLELQKAFFQEMYEGTKCPHASDDYNIVTSAKYYNELKKVCAGQELLSYSMAQYLAMQCMEYQQQLVRIEESGRNVEARKACEKQDLNHQVVAVGDIIPVLEEAAEDEQTNSSMHAGGCGTGNQTICRELVEIISNSSRVRRFAKCLGRMKEIKDMIANAKGLRGNDTWEVETTNSVFDCFQSERNLLCDSATEDLFFDRWQNSQLVSWEKEQESELGDGNVIVLLDVSGSMGQGVRVGKEDFTALDVMKSFIYMMLKDPDRAGKHDHLITFNYYVRMSLPITTNRDSSLLRQVLNVGSGGGTEFMPPLQEAANVIRNNPDCNFDILLITDAEIDAVDAKNIESEYSKLDMQNGRLFTVVINHSVHECFKPISDRIAHIDIGNDVLPQIENLADLMIELEDGNK